MKYQNKSKLFKNNNPRAMSIAFIVTSFMFGSLFSYNLSAEDVEPVTPVEVNPVTPTPTAATDIVQFDDPLVKRAVNKGLRVSDLDADVTEGQIANSLNKLTSITFNEEGTITSFKGLEKATYLSSITIGVSANSTAATSPTNLGTSDFSPLSGLSIKTFRLYSGNNTMTSLNSLSTLTALTSLTINASNITDFNALSTLTNLTDLSMNGIASKVISLNPALFTSLNLRNLTLSYVNFTSQPQFTSMTQLSSIRITESNLSDIRTLSPSAPLTSITLNGNPDLVDVSRIGQYNGLVGLNLNRNAIEDINFLKTMDLSKLVGLYMYTNKISDVSAVAHLSVPSLLSIDFSNNKISDASAFETLELYPSPYTSNYINLKNNLITDVSAFAKHIGKNVRVNVSGQYYHLPDVTLGDATTLSLKDAEGNDLKYYSRNDVASDVETGEVYGTFTLEDGKLVWDALTPEDNPRYNSLHASSFDIELSGGAAQPGIVYFSLLVDQNVVPKPEYTLTFDANTTDAVTVPDAVKALDGTVVTLADALVRDGYTFKGWNTAANGSGTMYDAGSELTLSGNMTLYAQWEKEVTVVPIPTGDQTALYAFVILGAISGAVVALLTMKRKRNKE